MAEERKVSEMTVSNLSRLPSCPLSYPAGASSWDPYRFRVVGIDSTNMVKNLIGRFPRLGKFFGPGTLMINGYAATLGLTGFSPSVDTYLHLPTFMSAMQLAAKENLNVVLTAQPLVAADFLYRATQVNIDLPRKILLGTGGYFMPQSLEDFTRACLKEHGVELDLIFSYGMAEVGHSLLCATERLPNAQPIYYQIADQIQLRADESSRLIILTKEGKTFHPGDFAEQRKGEWLIHCNPDRLDQRVRDELETWGNTEWERRTGYLHASDTGFKFQLRENVRTAERDELCYHLFWHQFGGATTTKPKWGWQK